jgi:hypothetical protein
VCVCVALMVRASEFELVICVCVGRLVRDDDDEKHHSYDGSNLDARTKCTDDERPSLGSLSA